MSSATKPVEQKAREILNRHCEYMDGIDRGQRMIGTSNALAAVIEALNTDGEKIRREAFEEAAKVALFHARDSRNGRAVRAECLAVHQDILSTPSKGVG